MSHIRDCPEFRLSRSDSKDPSTTCRGSRADGQRCRRKVASKAHLPKDGEAKLTHAQEFFCWQHRDQAPQAPVIAANSAAALKGRSSMDSLVERAGLLKVQDGPDRGNEAMKADHARQRVRRHSAHGAIRPSAAPAGREEVTASAKSTAKKRSSLGEKLFRLITGMSDDGVEIRIRRRARNTQATSRNSPQAVRTTPGRQAWSHNKTSGGRTASGTTSESPSAQPAQRLRRPPPAPLPSATSPTPASSGVGSRNSSSTQYLMSWIPPTLSPETTSRLLQKLGEPLSSAEETGYIYIYCVTPPSSAPSPDAASSLIPPPSTSKSDSTNHPRRTSDILQSAAIPTSTTRNPRRNQTTRTIMLKIGRAVNVSRRISQQCAHNLTLVRYYPYTPSTDGGPLPRKVRNIHRLERLIHIELADRRLKLEEPCEQCNKRHQEYFQIQARREQLQLVDECVRRWVEFSEQNP